MFTGSEQIEKALRYAGDLLKSEGEEVAVVVVGGATLNLLGIVARTTRDVDVIARAYREAGGKLRLANAEPFPQALERAIQLVARDLGLDEDWMNADVGKQWVAGLPPGTEDDLEWRTYGGLRVGLVRRRTLIALKLFATVDQGAGSVHLQDLLAMAPSDAELTEAAVWVRTQDAAVEFPLLVQQVVEHVAQHRP
ncbi:MAG TPA: hypothetical protein VGX50_16225 [Longimicrobium sp.]|nr:hypothetical protein [Longimicrobium sp.]